MRSALGVIASGVITGGACTDVLAEPFNNFTTNGWTNNGFTIVAGRTGTCAQSGGTSTLNYALPVASANLTVGFAFQVSTLASVRSLIWFKNGTTIHDRVVVNADGSLSVIQGSGAFLGTSAAGLVAIDTWYYLEVQITMSNTAGAAEVRLDGTTRVGPLTGVDTVFGTIDTTWTSVELEGSSGGTHRFDDLYLSSGAGCAFKGSQAYGTPAFVGVTNTSYTSRSNTTVTAPSGLTNSDYILLGILVGESGTNNPLDPTPPAGFTLLAGYPTTGYDGAFAVEMRVYGRIAASEGASWAFTHAARSTQGFALAYRNINQTTPIDANPSTNTGTGSTSTALSITTTKNGSMVVLIEHDWGETTNTLTPPTGTTPTFVERLDSPLPSGGIAYLADGILATAGATGNKTMTNNNTSTLPWVSTMLALRSVTAAAAVPITFVNGTNTTYASRTNTTVNAPSGLANGDYILLGFLIGESGSNPEDPTPPAGFTLLTGFPTLATGGAFSVEMRVYGRVAASEGASWTFTHTAHSTQGFAYAYRGVDQTTPLDTTPSTNVGLNNISTATGITTVTNGAMVVLIGHDWGNTANNLSPPGGTTPTFTERLDTLLGYVADGVMTAAGATGNKTWTNNNGTSDPFAAALIALRPAAP